MGPQTCETRAIERSEPKTGSDVLIAIPSLNEETHIESVISVLKADSGCSEATIVVSDAGSSDQTVAIVERIGSTDPCVRVLTTIKPLSPGAAVNRAVKCFGQGRVWLVRVDAHAAYPKDYASRLIAKAIETEASSVVTPMFLAAIPASSAPLPQPRTRSSAQGALPTDFSIGAAGWNTAITLFLI